MTKHKATSGSRVALYARVSTKQQASIPEQLSACKALAARLGLRVAYILKDEGVSGKSAERPGYQRVRELAATGAIDGVVVWKLDRLFRSLRHMLEVADAFEQQGTALYSVTEQFDTSTAFGRFAFRTMASAAELERDIISERSRLGRSTMATRGIWIGRHPPPGYSLGADRRLEVVPEEAIVVRQIFSWYKDDVPLTEIALRLTQPANAMSNRKPLSTTKIAQVVRNPIYVGEMHIGDRKHDRPDLRLIRTATWEAAQRRHGKRVEDGKGRERTNRAMQRIFDAYLRELRATPD